MWPTYEDIDGKIIQLTDSCLQSCIECKHIWGIVTTEIWKQNFILFQEIPNSICLILYFMKKDQDELYEMLYRFIASTVLDNKQLINVWDVKHGIHNNWLISSRIAQKTCMIKSINSSQMFAKRYNRFHFPAFPLRCFSEKKKHGWLNWLNSSRKFAEPIVWFFPQNTKLLEARNYSSVTQIRSTAIGQYS